MNINSHLKECKCFVVCKLEDRVKALQKTANTALDKNLKGVKSLNNKRMANTALDKNMKSVKALNIKAAVNIDR